MIESSLMNIINMQELLTSYTNYYTTCNFYCGVYDSYDDFNIKIKGFIHTYKIFDPFLFFII